MALAATARSWPSTRAVTSRSWSSMAGGVGMDSPVF
jgi:hypothetical protein